MNAVPKWYLPVTVLALVWNLMGCAAYLHDVMLTPADIAKMSAAEQSMYAARPAWGVAATAFAVWLGALGSLGLILRKRWAKPLLIGSLLGLLVQDVGMFVLTNTAQLAGPVVVVLQSMVLIIALALIYLAHRAEQCQWIAKPSPGG